MGPPEAQPKKIDWTSLPFKSTSIRVSNAELSIPEGFDVIPNFVSSEECLEILKEHDGGNLVWEGFEQRRRVQRWSRDDPDLPSCLKVLTERLEKSLGLLGPLHISTEEYPKSQLQRHFNDSQGTVTTFESTTRCDCQELNCTCFVATLPIAASVIEHINRPKQRSVDCWDLYSHNNHTAGLILDHRALFLKTKEYLWEWRSRISSAVDSRLELESPPFQRYVVVKFSRLQPTAPTSDDNKGDKQEQNDSNFGYVPKPEDLLPKTEAMPALEDLLTIIVTTSPIKSNPSTELLERVFDTFFHGGHDFALKCRKVIICDGCREKSDGVSKRHANPKQAMRNGIVDSEQLESYKEFKAALRRLCASAPPDSPFSKAEVEELESRHGYGFALRHALRNCVQTPYVIVIQHDRTFMRPCPIAESVRTMWHHPNIKYIGMSMRSNLMYRDIFLGKYGRSFMGEMASCILRPPELCLDSNLYGPDSHSTQNMDYSGQEKLRENISALMETYRTSQQNVDHVEWMRSNSLPAGKWQLSLTPTFFWYDNVHICETAHYRDFIFDPRYKMVVKGGFVEDKLSPVIKKTVERLGLAQGHARFGCFLLDDHSGMFFTGHLDGGSYLTKAEKEVVSTGMNGEKTILESK